MTDIMLYIYAFINLNICSTKQWFDIFDSYILQFLLFHVVFIFHHCLTFAKI